MTWTDYVGFIAASLGAFLVGRCLIETSIFSSYLAGVAFLGSILAVTGWLIPAYSRQIVYSLFIICAIYQASRPNLRPAFQEFQPIIIVYLIFGLVVFNHFNHKEYFYNNHDPAYWGYAFELLKADYLGPIRLPTFYPEQFAPTHLLPSTAVASLASFIPDVTLPKLIEVRYLLLSIVFAGLFYRFADLLKERAPYFLLGAVVTFRIFELEIGYNLLISSYFYVLLFAEIVVLIFSPRPDGRAILLFSLFLVIARGPIAYVAAGLFAYYWYYFKHQRFDPRLIVTVGVIICVGATWVAFPAPFSGYCLNLQTNIMNPFNLDNLSYMSRISEWVMPDLFKRLYFDVTYIPTTKDLQLHVGFSQWVREFLPIITIMIYVVIKFYITTVWATQILKKVPKSEIINIKLLNGILLYSGISLLGWIFIRNGVLFDHQAHAFLLMSIPAFLTISLVVAFNPKKLFFLAPIAFVYSLADGLLHKPFEGTFSYGIPHQHIRYSSERHQPQQYKFYFPHENQPMWESELEALMSGKRVRASDYNSTVIEVEFSGDNAEATSIMSGWVVSPKYLRNCESE